MENWSFDILSNYYHAVVNGTRRLEKRAPVEAISTGGSFGRNEVSDRSLYDRVYYEMNRDTLKKKKLDYYHRNKKAINAKRVEYRRRNRAVILLGKKVGSVKIARELLGIIT
jgi:hypothetical protein